MPRSQPITVELEEEQASLERHLASGDYDSPSDVLRAGLRALDREMAVTVQTMREKIREALDDPRPDIPAQEVLRRLHERHAKRWAGQADDV